MKDLILVEKIDELRNSKDFMNIMIDEITSGLFILNKDLTILGFNRSFDKMFPYIEDKINILCGNTIGCVNTINENIECGNTSQCEFCKLKNSAKNSFINNEPINDLIIKHEYYINETDKELKYIKFSTRIIKHNHSNLVLGIINDISEIELQRLELKSKNEEIIQSINYAHIIQNAILPSPKEELAENLDHFVLYKPKDIIGGDFYWHSNKNNKIAVAVADCTGHGVPGATLSMMGITLLNEIINKCNIFEPNLILTELKRKFSSYFKPSKEKTNINDGMDIGLCIIDFKEGMLHYSGANIPLIIVRNNEIIKIKADKKPISYSDSSNDFVYTTHKIQMLKGDTYYLSSDGFQDQFGGPNGKKYKSKNFRALLQKINQLEMSTQKKILEQAHASWQEKEEQTDDICIMGINIDKL